jgi:hypothetical protein
MHGITGPPPLYGLDIETDTATDGLDPSIGRVLAVAVAGSRSVDVFDHADEARLLVELDRHLGALAPGVLVTWNGARFDLPYLATRAERLDVSLGLRLVADRAPAEPRPPLPCHAGAYRASWCAHDHLDAYRLYRADVGPALRLPCSLKVVARLAGLRPVEVDPGRVHELAPSTLAAYVGSDAACASELARRRWATARRSLDGAAMARSLAGQALR